MKRIIVLFVCICLQLTGICQDVKDSLEKIPFFGFSYSFHLPSGDLSDRFGPSSSAGIGFHIKTKKNITLGFETGFIFGNVVREDNILDSVSANAGFIIDQNGQFATVRLFERGMTWTGNIGKLIPVIGPNPNSGILLSLGLGGMYHRIRIDDIGNRSPQLTGDYKKGYDRLTSGYTISEFIGYIHFGNKKKINFFAGIESFQSFTKSRRTYNFDTMEQDTRQRFDMLTGVRLGWMLPLYKKTAKEIYYH